MTLNTYVDQLCAELMRLDAPDDRQLLTSLAHAELANLTPELDDIFQEIIRSNTPDDFKRKYPFLSFEPHYDWLMRLASTPAGVSANSVSYLGVKDFKARIVLAELIHNACIRLTELMKDSIRQCMSNHPAAVLA